MENNKYELFQGDCLELLKNIESESIDAIITDPPYQYLDTKKKNCHFDKPYDEEKYIKEVKRCLKDTGFIVMFGRGVAYYRQGVLLAEAGFKFKEEIVWNKRKDSSPMLALGRRHENCFIFSKTKKATIRKCKFPYIEYLKNISIEDAVQKIKNNIRKINEDIKKPEIFKAIMQYLEKDVIEYTITQSTSNNITMKKDAKRCCYSVSSLQTIIKGAKECDIINIPDMIEEASLRNSHHPTEKPVRLMERLIALVTNENDIVLDTFMGSGTTGVACMNTNRRFIGMELDNVYFTTAQQRLKKQKTLLI
ncbi:MAG: DNA-methyltransferase [Treponema sp.]